MVNSTVPALQKKYSALITALLCLTGAFLIMMICTRSSFLYPYNNWDDSNSYFTMGKSWFHGYVPYRDLFDQKGPWLYFVYGLCSLVSPTDFTGVFILEIIIAAICIGLMYRSAVLFLKPCAAMPAAVITAALIYSSRSFYWGGCSEELLLPFLLWPLYHFMRILRSSDPDERFSSGRLVCITGFCCGMAAATKFILLGFFMAYALIVVLEVFSVKGLSVGRKFLNCLKKAGLFLLFVLIPFIPWLIWFACRGALDDWYRDYIYTNVFLYSSFGANSKGLDIAGTVKSLLKIFYWLCRQNLQYMLPAVIGMAASLSGVLGTKTGRKDLLKNAALPFMFLALFIGIFIGGSELPYYSFPLTAFAITGTIALFGAAASFIRRITAGKRMKDRPERTAAGGQILFIVTALLAVIAGTCLSLSLTMNRYYMSYRKDDVFLSRFSEIIAVDGRPDATLFNYNCLDCGLLTAAGLYPGSGCYWFQTQTLPTDEVLDEQHRYILEGLTDYVVARASYPDFIYDRYELADSFDQQMGNNGELSFTYYLFRRKE
ncbi:MAG: hypothetical protein J6P87_00655 [Lachnospiraceae bacterium]|nr:hypothetical protein [Lachnospiraceae bacterium]